MGNKHFFLIWTSSEIDLKWLLFLQSVIVTFLQEGYIRMVVARLHFCGWEKFGTGGTEIVGKVALGGSIGLCGGEGGATHHSPFAAKWSKKPATLTFTPFLKTLFPNVLGKIWKHCIGSIASGVPFNKITFDNCLCLSSGVPVVHQVPPEGGQMCRCNCM